MAQVWGEKHKEKHVYTVFKASSWFGHQKAVDGRVY